MDTRRRRAGVCRQQLLQVQPARRLAAARLTPYAIRPPPPAQAARPSCTPARLTALPWWSCCWHGWVGVGRRQAVGHVPRPAFFGKVLPPALDPAGEHSNAQSAGGVISISISIRGGHVLGQQGRRSRSCSGGQVLRAATPRACRWTFMLFAASCMAHGGTITNSRNCAVFSQDRP